MSTQCAQPGSKLTSTNQNISILTLGDSYTIGSSVEIDHRWPIQLQSAIEKKHGIDVSLKIIAKSGWRTDDLRKAIIEENITTKYDYVTLLIGVNNQYQKKAISDYPQEFNKCIDQAINFTQSLDNVIVISIPDYAYTPFGQTKDPKRISKEIDQYNDINKRISIERGVKYVDITDITRIGLSDPALVAKDGLHPSGKCYSYFIPRILQIMKL